MSNPSPGQYPTPASTGLAANSAAAVSPGPTTSPNTDWRKPNAVPPQDEKCLIKFARCMAPLFKDRVIVTSSKCTIYCNFVLVALLLVIGVIIRGTANNAQEYQVRFDDKCKSGTNCVFNLLIREKMTGPIYIYLHFNNLFINHRKVMKSLNKKQLMGEEIDIDTLKTTCEGRVKNSDFANAKTALQGKGLAYDADAALNPCGIYATLFPTDTFSLQKMTDANDEVVESTLEISTSNLVYGNLKGNKFKTTDQTKNKQWIDVQQERFIEWMKAPLSSNFYKLWGIVNQDLPKGNYRITISGDLGLVGTTKIQKELYFTNLTWLGGNNPFMYYAFFMVAIFLLFVGGALLYIEKLDKAEYD